MKKIILILLILAAVIAVIFARDKSQSLVYKDLIKVESPKEGARIASPLVIKGEARGNWFFEASFPVFVVDWDGKIIGQGVARAEGDWMTQDYVPFSAEISFDKSQISGNYSDKGSIILKKDNPSGLPEHDDAFEFPIYFK